MAIEKVVRCDNKSCNKVVEPNKGFVVLGNIHKVGKTDDRVAPFDCVGGGLVGNNLEEREVQKASYYCEFCFADLLGLNVRPAPVTRSI